MALSLRICKHNVHGFSETKCDYIQGLLASHDIAMLQEHWVYDSQTHVIKNKFPDISLHRVSGMNDNCLRVAALYNGNRHYRVLLSQLLLLITEFLLY